MKDHSKNVAYIYRVTQPWGEPEYLKAIGRSGPDSYWGRNKAEAVRMPITKAQALVRKWRKGLDAGARNPYGWDVDYSISA